MQKFGIRTLLIFTTEMACIVATSSLIAAEHYWGALVPMAIIAGSVTYWLIARPKP